MATPAQNRGNPELPRPSAQAILLCDQIIREAVTNKITLVGVFNRFYFPEFPAAWTRPSAVYARVTDAQGQYTFRLDLVRLDDDQSIGRLELVFSLDDRIASYDLIFPIDSMRFDRAGVYEFQLFADLMYVGRMPLYVIQRN